MAWEWDARTMECACACFRTSWGVCLCVCGLCQGMGGRASPATILQFAWVFSPPSQSHFPQRPSFAKLHPPLAALPTSNSTGYPTSPQLEKLRLGSRGNGTHSAFIAAEAVALFSPCESWEQESSVSGHSTGPFPTTATRELKPLFSCLDNLAPA